MPRISRSIPGRYERILSAWQHHRPNKSYFGLTLEQFRAAIQPSIAVREEIRDLQRKLRAAFLRRPRIDVVAGRVIRGVVYSVRGDPQDGPDCARYVAMGFMPASAHGRRISKGRKRAKMTRARASGRT